MKIIHAINNFFWHDLPNEELTLLDYTRMYGGMIGAILWVAFLAIHLL